MVKLKLQYFGHLIQRVDSLEKTPMLGKIEDRRRKRATESEELGWHHQLNSHELEQTLGDIREQRKEPGMKHPMRLQRVR